MCQHVNYSIIPLRKSFKDNNTVYSELYNFIKKFTGCYTALKFFFSFFLFRRTLESFWIFCQMLKNLRDTHAFPHWSLEASSSRLPPETLWKMITISHTSAHLTGRQTHLFSFHHKGLNWPLALPVLYPHLFHLPQCVPGREMLFSSRPQFFSFN